MSIYLDVLKDRKRDLILKVIKIVVMLSMIAALFYFAADYHTLLMDTFYQDSVSVMVFVLPYMMFGFILLLVLIMDLADHDYTFRAYRNIKKIIIKNNL